MGGFFLFFSPTTAPVATGLGFATATLDEAFVVELDERAKEKK